MDWKEANVVPVFKSGYKNVATNCRPVTLTGQLRKVFGMIAWIPRGQWTYKRLTSSQHGFKKGS